jgi:hypothetical protein
VLIRSAPHWKAFYHYRSDNKFPPVARCTGNTPTRLRIAPSMATSSLLTGSHCPVAPLVLVLFGGVSRGAPPSPRQSARQRRECTPGAPGRPPPPGCPSNRTPMNAVINVVWTKEKTRLVYAAVAIGPDGALVYGAAVAQRNGATRAALRAIALGRLARCPANASEATRAAQPDSSRFKALLRSDIHRGGVSGPRRVFSARAPADAWTLDLIAQANTQSAAAFKGKGRATGRRG